MSGFRPSIAWLIVARAAPKGATSSIQPSLPGLDASLKPTQHYVLGYFQPSRQCRDS